MSIQETKVMEITFSHNSNYRHFHQDNLQELTDIIISDFKAMAEKLEELREDGYRIVSNPFEESKVKPVHYRLVFDQNLAAVSNQPISTPTEMTPALKEILATSVDTLEISVRSFNCLKHSDIDTIGQLVQKTEYELSHTKNMGRKSLNEIKDVLDKMGLRLGMMFSE